MRHYEQSANRIELMQGTLDMLILRTLLLGPAHGHEIAKHIQRTTDEVLQVEHGSLYPALHRLERKGWVTAKWEMPKDRKREFKYYRLTLPVFWHLPLRRDPAFSLQAMKRRVKRPMLNLQHVVRGALDVLGDFVPVSGTQHQSPHDQHVQRPLHELNSVG